MNQLRKATVAKLTIAALALLLLPTRSSRQSEHLPSNDDHSKHKKT